MDILNQPKLIKLVKLLKECGHNFCNLVIRESAVYVELKNKDSIYIPIPSGYPFSFIVVDVENNEIRVAHDYSDAGSVFSPPPELITEIEKTVKIWFLKQKPSNWQEIYKI